MKLIVGLGNPGFKYVATRHNIGFRVIDNFAAKKQIKIEKEEQEALTGSFHFKGEKVILAKPQTYMNNSGRSVGKLADWYNIALKDIIIIYDDLDLKTGQLKIKPSGGHGGHNGVKSIFNHLGTTDISRVRVGIGRPPEYMTVTDYVLGKFDNEEEDKAARAVKEAVEAIEDILLQGIEQSMNNYN
ncbi:aminoacyl-tRNA hydrolase [Sporohalobacter salinus]|uniref:aminoacyl-tRNA hydrolase n=1 Tax=Sporohalobacter salinus TaxID=1494606 RepID=UPI0019613639|nr:aminoacyl-tRNA hydrolase [Sporohalobacter salinus]MBM7623892.1 PTH1 family peptidyl-tRNA hydrolase [Sporohalobacter salinus]